MGQSLCRYADPVEGTGHDDKGPVSAFRGLLTKRFVKVEKLAEGRPILAMTHYPPLYDQCRDTAFTALMERYGVAWAICGHLHGAGIKAGFTGEHNGVHYALTSCDALEFRLMEISLDV